jgi:hypothetical protein
VSIPAESGPALLASAAVEVSPVAEVSLVELLSSSEQDASNSARPKANADNLMISLSCGLTGSTERQRSCHVV